MFRKTSDTRYTASISRTNEVVVSYDEGWEDLIAYRKQFPSKDEATAYLTVEGYEEYDPNASLKAQGLVFINGCYRRP